MWFIMLNTVSLVQELSLKCNYRNTHRRRQNFRGIWSQICNQRVQQDSVVLKICLIIMLLFRHDVFLNWQLRHISVIRTKIHGRSVLIQAINHYKMYNQYQVQQRMHYRFFSHTKNCLESLVVEMTFSPNAANKLARGTQLLQFPQALGFQCSSRNIYNTFYDSEKYVKSSPASTALGDNLLHT